MLEKMKKTLTENDAYLLKKIYEPKIMAVPPDDAARYITVTGNGEIRVYGMINNTGIHTGGDPVYLSSENCGLSWKYVVYDKNSLGRSSYCPYNDKYMVFNYEDNENRKGLYLKVADSPDDTNIRYIKMSDTPVRVERLPLMLEKFQRIIAIGQVYDENNVITPVILHSDDCGETWKETTLTLAPKHEIKYPHKGLRWQNYSCEPTVCELDDKLIAIVRTSQDFHYYSYSYDFGESWTPVLPTTFHSTLTMPTLKRLSDGKIVFSWCNTQPLPELDHANDQPETDEFERSGYWEDVFTNRDAAHLAISEDNGRTWTGFREIHLNSIRNFSDFRSHGGILDGQDKSVHQSEILELPYNKLLISSGQHSASRKIIILDRDWLYEKSRFEDFRCGLSNLSTQVYLKSISGCFRHFSGHCAWNRTNGAVLMPAPEFKDEEALFLCSTNDPRLFSNVQGAVWNFPASRKGEIEFLVKICGKGIAVSLTDRWLNPIDTYIRECAQLSFRLTKDIISDKWTKINIKYDTDLKAADIYADGKIIQSEPLRFEIPNGLSYLHLQTVAEKNDFDGTYIKYLKAF